MTQKSLLCDAKVPRICRSRCGHLRSVEVMQRFRLRPTRAESLCWTCDCYSLWLVSAKVPPEEVTLARCATACLTPRVRPSCEIIGPSRWQRWDFSVRGSPGSYSIQQLGQCHSTGSGVEPSIVLRRPARTTRQRAVILGPRFRSRRRRS
jgi:hypothetical protein